MIQAVVNGDDALLARLDAMPAALRDAIAGRMAGLAAGLQQHIQRDKLSGQVLHARTGRLRAGIEVAIEAGPQGLTATVSSAAPQAAALEYGFQGSETVRAQLRTIAAAFGRPLRQGARQVLVPGYGRRVDLPARSFLRSALADMAEDIARELAAVVDSDPGPGQ